MESHDPTTAQPGTVLSYVGPIRELGPRRPWALACMALSLLLASAVIGATTNAINGKVSPEYFVAIMGWAWDGDLWSNCIRQGILEGSVVGFLCVIVFSIWTAIASGLRCTFRQARPYLIAIVATTYGCWIVGGIFGATFAMLDPVTFRNWFIDVPAGRLPMLRYAWVGGSISGGELGGALAMFFILIVFTVRWHRHIAIPVLAER